MEMNTRETTVLSLKRKVDFVETPYVKNISDRALSYLKTGYPVHFSGPAGTGKTTMAMHIAAKLGQPVILIHGDDEIGSSDLIGGQMGYRSTRVVDNYIHSVMKTEENVSKVWMDNRLTTACKYGLTLIYDEFNRSRAEANNVLLGILEERLLELPTLRSGEGYMQVHPSFHAIFTSNPEEYAGVHKTQDALMDRMITIKVGHYDRDTEAAITAGKSKLSEEDAGRIVDVVRAFRKLGANHYRPTIRACLMIARISALRSAQPDADDPVFREICRDVLCTDTLKEAESDESISEDLAEQIIRRFCPPKIEIISGISTNGAAIDEKPVNGSSANGTEANKAETNKAETKSDSSSGIARMESRQTAPPPTAPPPTAQHKNSKQRSSSR